METIVGSFFFGIQMDMYEQSQQIFFGHRFNLLTIF